MHYLGSDNFWAVSNIMVSSFCCYRMDFMHTAVSVLRISSFSSGFVDFVVWCSVPQIMHSTLLRSCTTECGGCKKRNNKRSPNSQWPKTNSSKTCNEFEVSLVGLAHVVLHELTAALVLTHHTGPLCAVHCAAWYATMCAPWNTQLRF